MAPKELVSPAVATVQPPPPKNEVECSTLVALMPLVDMPQVESTPALSNTVAADVLAENETLMCSVSGLWLAEAKEPMEMAHLEVPWPSPISI